MPDWARDSAGNMPAAQVPPPPKAKPDLQVENDVMQLIEDGKPFQEIMRAIGGLDQGNTLVQALEEHAAKNEQERKAFLDDARRLQRRLESQGRGLLDPKGKFLQYWDFVTMFALVYTMLVTPFEVGCDVPTKIDALFVANQLITLIFLCDIVVQFFLPTSLGGVSGNFERRHSVLAKNYMSSGWFFIDVITVVPWDIMVWQRVLDTKTKATKLLRILRLLKLVKVLRASRILQRWDHTFGIASSTKTLSSYGIAMLLIIHLFACAWCFIPVLVGTQRGDVGTDARLALEASISWRQELDADCNACIFGQVDIDGDSFISDSEQAANPTMAALCLSPCLTACERSALAELKGWTEAFVYMSESWICRAVDSGQLSPEFTEKPGEVYWAALLVSMLQMVGGVSTILPMNTVEYIWFFIVILCGTILFAVIQGVICGVATNGDPEETAWIQKNDQLNAMMADIGVAQEQRLFVRSHFRKAKKLFKRQSYDELITSCLSTELQGDVRYYMCQQLFSHVWYLAACDKSFLEDLSVKLFRQCFAPKEAVDCDEKLVVITQGMLSRNGAFLGSPSYFGDIILSSPMLRDTTEAKALTYCEVAVLKRPDLYEVLEDYPDAANIIKQASLKLALKRATLIVAGLAKADTAIGFRPIVHVPVGDPRVAAQEASQRRAAAPNIESSGLKVLQEKFCRGTYNQITNDGTVVSTGSAGSKDMDADAILKRAASEPKDTQTFTLLKSILKRQDAMIRSIRNLEKHAGIASSKTGAGRRTPELADEHQSWLGSMRPGSPFRPGSPGLGLFSNRFSA